MPVARETTAKAGKSDGLYTRQKETKVSTSSQKADTEENANFRFLRPEIPLRRAPPCQAAHDLQNEPVRTCARSGLSTAGSEPICIHVAPGESVAKMKIPT